jgi:hypothetical protein
MNLSAVGTSPCPLNFSIASNTHFSKLQALLEFDCVANRFNAKIKISQFYRHLQEN